MTIQEFSDQFDTLLDSHRFKNPFGDVENVGRIRLDEYEKSVLLTEAQDLQLRANFTTGFDRTEQGQIYFSNLITVGEGTPDIGSITGYSEDGKIFKLPKDIFWMLNERIIDTEGNRYTIKPINYEEFDRIESKPYAKPLKRQAWRLYQGIAGDQDSPYAEIVTRNDNAISKYVVRYIRKPKPIILENLGNLTIQGISTPTECELNPLTHFDILSKAVELAMSRHIPVTNEE